MTTDSLAVVRVARQFSASPERVFDAWLDPALAGRWLFATPAGQMVRVDIDPHVGGAFRFVDRRNGQDIDHVGTCLELDRPRRLVFTFAVPAYSPVSSQVSIDIAPTETGCTLTLTQEQVPANMAERSTSGWTTVLSALAAMTGDS